MKTTWIIGLVVVIGLVGGGLFASSNLMTGEVLSSDLPTSNVPTGDVKEITITVGPNSEYSFDKPRLTVNQGDSVKVTFRNTGRIIHNWAIPKLNTQTPVIQPGAVASTEFIASSVGTYEYICTVPGHRERGMLGALTIS